MTSVAGRLAICPTPIGNLGDITLRVLDELRSADLILAEDTRRTGILLEHYGIRAETRSCHAHNEAARAAELVAHLRAGRRVALVSDAGTPGVSDPGYRLVQAAVATGAEVTALPGPSAILPALLLSGLPVAPFAFMGFVPRTAPARAASLRQGCALPLTTVWFEAPHRARATLAELCAQGLGGRPAALARELTKVHEEVRRGTIQELAEGSAADPPRGEIVLVVGPAPTPPPSANLDVALDGVRALRSRGRTLSAAVAAVARECGVSRSRLYAAALEVGLSATTGGLPAGGGEPEGRRPRPRRRPSP